jgi:hypothetical protein
MTNDERLMRLYVLMGTRTLETINVMATVSLIDELYNNIKTETPDRQNLDCLATAGRELFNMTPDKESFERTMVNVYINLDRFLGSN